MLLGPLVAFTRIALREGRRRRPSGTPAEHHLLRRRVVAVPGTGRHQRRRRQLRLFAARRLAAAVSRDLGLHRHHLLSAGARARSDYLERARGSSPGCSRIQNADGSFANPRYGADGIVFDTGQVLFGLVRGYELTARAAVLAAATPRRRLADADRRRRTAAGRATSTSARPTSTTRAPPGRLLRMNQLEADAGARGRSLAPTSTGRVAEQRASGYLRALRVSASASAPFTHTIAYTTRGLLESGLLLGEAALPRRPPSAAPCDPSADARRRPPPLDDRDRRQAGRVARAA